MKQVIVEVGADFQGALQFIPNHPDVYYYLIDPCPAPQVAAVLADVLKLPNADLIQRAAWVCDGHQVMRVAGKGGCSSTLAANRHLRGHRTTEVECLDLSRWVLDNIHPEDKNVLKMDVEGAEYTLVPDLIKRGAMSLFSKLFVEGHCRKMTNHLEMWQIHLEYWQWCRDHGIEIHDIMDWRYDEAYLFGDPTSISSPA